MRRQAASGSVPSIAARTYAGSWARASASSSAWSGSTGAPPVAKPAASTSRRSSAYLDSGKRWFPGSGKRKRSALKICIGAGRIAAGPPPVDARARERGMTGAPHRPVPPGGLVGYAAPHR